MLIYRILLALTAIAVVHRVLYNFTTLRHFRYDCALSKRKVLEGDTIELYETIENRSFLPMLWLRVETRFEKALLFTRNDNTHVSAGLYHRSVFSAPPFRRVRRTYEILCSKRGYYRFGASTVTTGDYMGINNVIVTDKSDIELHVCPRPLPRHEVALPTRSWQGDMVVRRFILPDPFMPAGVRDYSPSDPMSAVNWKASAKTGGLVVHRRDYTADSNLMVFFNIDESSAQWTYADPMQNRTMERALRLTAAIVDVAIANGMKTALRTNAVSSRNGGEVTAPPAFGRTHRDDIFTLMAEIKLIRTRSFHMLLHEAAGTVRDTDILLLTRFLTKEAKIEIERLRRSGNKVEIYMIPDYIEQSPAGGIAI